MPDQGTVSIDWAYPTNSNDTQDVCLIFPGLSGHSRKTYVSSLVRYLVEDCGLVAGVFHNRGVDQELTSTILPDITSSQEIK